MLSVCLPSFRSASRSASVVDTARTRVSVGSTSFNTTRSRSNGSRLFRERGIELKPVRKRPQGQGRDVVSDCKDRIEIIGLRRHAMSQNVGKTTFGARC